MSSVDSMEELFEAGATCGRLLMERGERVAIGECSCGGLISAALLAVPGASAFYVGAAVVYTRAALRSLLSGVVEAPNPLQGASESWALHLARSSRLRLGADWGIGEGGAAGPTGNRYGDPAGHAWVAVSGPSEGARHVLTGDTDRLANMVAFAAAGLRLFEELLA
jgi:nicotinamide-nucleotide amidase